MVHKSILTTFITLVALLALAGIAGAHAVVFPQVLKSNSYEKFILRVPTEKETATVKVRVEIPEGFAISRVKPMPGWTYTVEKSTDGKSFKAITWADGKILSGEFQEFEFQGKTAKEPGKFAFRAFQTYADGETVEWTGPSDAKTPAPSVELKAAPASTAAGDDDDDDVKPGATPKPSSPAAPGTSAAPLAGTNPLATGAAYGGLALGAIALVLSLRRR